METREKDFWEKWLQSCPDPAAPPGFAERLQERLTLSPQLAPEFPSRASVPGVLCIASAFVLFISLHTPLLNAIPEIIHTLEGVFS